MAYKQVTIGLVGHFHRREHYNMLLLGLDLETTGFSFEDDAIIEIGAALWDTEIKKPVRLLSGFVLTPKTPMLSDEIVEITGITQNMLESWGKDFSIVYTELFDLSRDCEYLVAHNGVTFDKPFLQAECGKFSMGFVEQPWIDTTTDVEYPPRISTRKLTHLAAEHGFLNPFPHRAVFDVLTMMQVLSCYPLDDIVRLANEPTVLLQAGVEYKDRELAKARGYRWKAETKQWIKPLKQSKAAIEKKEAGFPVREIKQ